MDLNNHWNNTKPSDDNYELVPEGEYQAYIDGAKYIEKDGNTQVSITWKITGPTHAKRLLFANYKLINKGEWNEKGASRMRGDIEALGLTILDFKTLPNELGYLTGKTATVNVTHSEWQGKTYANTWLDRKSVQKGNQGTTFKTATEQFDADEQIGF